MAATETASGGIGLSGAVFIVFLVMKLTHVISWSWLWVTAPLWGGVALAFTVIAFAMVFIGVVALVGMVRK